jgi:hypothetical protein
MAVANETATNPKQVLRENVEKAAHVMTDDSPAYKFVGKEYARHSAVNHTVLQY